jgi:hypothetical protein
MIKKEETRMDNMTRETAMLERTIRERDIEFDDLRLRERRGVGKQKA